MSRGERFIGELHIVCKAPIYLVGVNDYLSQQWSNCVNLVNMVSQGGELLQISCLIYRCTPLKRRRVVFLVNVIGMNRGCLVKTLQTISQVGIP